MGPPASVKSVALRTHVLIHWKSGKIYRIREVKNTEHPCMVHESGKVKVVDVEKATIKTAIDSKRAFEGSNIVFFPLNVKKTVRFEGIMLS